MQNAHRPAYPLDTAPKRLLAVSCGLLLLAAAPCRAIIVNRILATVDGAPITLYELKNFTLTNPMAQQIGANNPGALLDGLITSRLIDLEIEKNGISVSEAEIDNYILQIRQQNQISEEELYRALGEQGLTPEIYRAQIRQELERAQLINREIRGKVSVTPEDIQRYYEANASEYSQDPEVTVSHIMLRLAGDATETETERVEAKAREIHALLERGKDFADLARQYSEDPAAESGGALGTFRVGTLLDALNDAVATLGAGEYSEPVRSDVGIHIVRLDKRSDAALSPLDQHSGEIRDRLYNQALEGRYSRWLTEDLRNRHHVELLE